MRARVYNQSARCFWVFNCGCTLFLGFNFWVLFGFSLLDALYFGLQVHFAFGHQFLGALCF